MKLRRSPLEAVAHQVMMVLWKCPFQVLKNFFPYCVSSVAFGDEGDGV